MFTPGTCRKLLLRVAACAIVLLVASSAQAVPGLGEQKVALRGRGTPAPAWLTKRSSRAWIRLGRGIQKDNHAGAVVAAPSGNPEYQFHWTRDAAIAMSEVVQRTLTHRSGPTRDGLVEKIKRYVAFSLKATSVDSPAGRGEPKYYLDGRPYVDPWGRPQNDGPALRALSLLSFAEWSLRNNDADYVRDHLYDPANTSAHGQLIKADLDYLVEHHREASFDVWEEERGHHFYTRAVQAHALARGARLAEQLGDEERATRYRATARTLRDLLDDHWDGRYNLIRATHGHEGGIQHKWTGLDSAVILAANHTAGNDGPLKVLDGRLLSTAALLEVDFRNKYAVNDHGQLGFLAGRYPEDRYTGQPHQDRDEGGNPWVVTTHGFAEYYFRVAGALAGAPYFRITSQNRNFVLGALGERHGSPKLPVGTHLVAGDPRLDEIASAVFRKGDAFLKAVDERVGDGPQREQIDRSSGAGLGAEELTWNYASLLSATRARGQALDQLRQR